MVNELDEIIRGVLLHHIACRQLHLDAALLLTSIPVALRKNRAVELWEGKLLTRGYSGRLFCNVYQPMLGRVQGPFNSPN